MLAADDDRVFFFLDSPRYHRLEFGKPNRFAGVVFDSRDTPLSRIGASFDGDKARKFPVNLPSEDIARHIPHLSSAKRCRFDFELLVPEASRGLALDALDDLDRSRARLEYDFDSVRASADSLRTLTRILDRIPAPPPEIVFLTQGHSDSIAYQESIIPGIFNERRYLAASGVKMGAIRSVLDLGCGSGRSLVGWYLDDPTRELLGCDINDELIGWAKANLPQALRVERSSVEPPLGYPDDSFDLIDVVSVLTHLGFPSQRRWADEIGRILRPGGVVLLTAHGDPYVQLFHPDRREEYDRLGHFEIPTGEEGSNNFASFHAPAAVRELFAGLEPIGFFPSGRIGGKRVLFPLAAFQDVYLLRK